MSARPSIRAFDNRRDRRRGGVLIEAAFALIILVIMTGGMIEFGWLIFVTHTATGAARSGARAAIVAGAVKSDVQTAVNNIMTAAGWTSTKYTVQVDDKTGGTTDVDPSSIAVGHDVAVHVKSTWADVGVSVFNFVSSTRAIDCVVVMRKES
jgi:Flp pilus assembly protein TadG